MKFKKDVFTTYEEVGAYLAKKFGAGKLTQTFYAYHDDSGICTEYYLLTEESRLRWDHEWQFRYEDPGTSYPFRRYYRTSKNLPWAEPLWMTEGTWTVKVYQ